MRDIMTGDERDKFRGLVQAWEDAHNALLAARKKESEGRHEVEAAEKMVADALNPNLWPMGRNIDRRDVAIGEVVYVVKYVSGGHMRGSIDISRLEPVLL